MLKKLYKDYMEIVGSGPLYDYNFAMDGSRPEWSEANYRRTVKVEPDNMDDVMVEALVSEGVDRDVEVGGAEEREYMHPEREDIYHSLTFRSFNKTKQF